MVKNKMNKKALVVFFMLFSGIILPFSGLTLHHAESHELLYLRWISMAVHNVVAIIFTISVIIHVKNVRKSIQNYLRNKMSEIIGFPRELLVASTSIVLLIALSIIHVFQSHL
jgi:hypothetical protein